MSKINDKYSSTFYNHDKKKLTKTPPKNDSSLRRTYNNTYDIKKKGNDNMNLQEISHHQKDQRYKYLLKHGQLKKIQKCGNIIFAELPQIPNVWVCYRRPCQRQSNIDKLSLDSINLTHIPLLQGEQKLKMLTFQHNKINRIENFISLPNLLYIDLFDNQIRQLQNLSIGSLKVLLLPKNLIIRIKNLNQLIKLDVLDLHCNKINKIQGLGFLNCLKVLNLAENQISKLENLENLINLNELNLKNNNISSLQGLPKLCKLEKLYLSNNRIQIKKFENNELTKLMILKQLFLEKNPCSQDRINYLKNIIKYLSNVKLLDGKPPILLDTYHSNNNAHQKINDQHNSDEESDHEQVLNLLAEQWEQEKNRIMQIVAINGAKRQYLRTTCITGGHAEIQDENILFIYGNSFDMVLSNPKFQETVEKIRFEFIFIEFLIEQNVLTTLKKFKKLRILQFSQNYVMSLLQIAKLQNLAYVRSINIEPTGNPITNCTFLKQFIIYRFPSIIQINKQDIKQSDRLKAKTLFQNFDKVLQIPQKTMNPQNMRNYPCQQIEAKKDRNYLKLYNKLINQSAEYTIDNCSKIILDNYQLKCQLENNFDLVMKQLIQLEQKQHCYGH